MKARGFTLIEISIVLIVAAILWSAAVASYGNSDDCLDKPRWGQAAARASAISGLMAINLEVDRFNLSNGRNPTSLDEIGMADNRDPWGSKYIYLDFSGITGNGPKRKYKNDNPVNTYFDAYSMGRDGATAIPFTSSPGEDDIVIAKNGAFIGVACEYGQ